jgi:aminomethyltransferase
VHVEGRRVGEVTSGNFSPVLGRGIGLALLEGSFSPGVAVEVESRGRRIPGTVCTLPFVDKKP